MSGIMLTEASNRHNSLLEIYRLAKRLIIQCMGNNRLTAIVMHIHFNTFDSALQILHISLDFRVTCQLVAT